MSLSLSVTLLDVLLVALVAGVTAAGIRRGLAGLAGGLVTLVVWFGANQLGHLHPLVALAVALAAGLAIGRFTSVLEPVPASSLTGPHAALGGLGGFVAGLGLAAALALSFPTYSNPADLQGRYQYPSGQLPAPLLEAVGNSAVQRFLSEPRERGGLGLWTGPAVLRGLLIPDH